MKLGLVGSRSYSNVDKVRQVIQKYIERYGFDNLTIVSGGCMSGGDFIAKNLALEIGLKYVEFPPAHFSHNSFCVLPIEEYYKPYKVSNYFERNGKIAEYSDHIVAFTVKGVKCNGTLDTVNKAKKLNKPVIVYDT